tara:strand:+ start:189 stop:2624 length:2436 start_codon:yes stop_codon:yes gene_type:complete
MSTTKTLSVFLKLNSKAFTSSLKSIEGKLGKFSRKLGSIGSSMTTNVSMPLLGIGAMAVKTASEFDASMTKIQTLVGASAEEVDSLKNSVLELAGETATAPKDLAEGLFFIQSAGFKGAESLEALEVASKGAAMGMGEMGDISNALTSIMTGYADSGMTATRAGDLLHETLKQGKFEAGDFMSKLGSVIPTAAAFGISFEQLGASVATMSKLSGDAAGSLTAVNKLMMSLNAPAEQQSEILNKVFGSYDNLSKSLKSDFAGTLSTIFTSLEGNDQELIKVFGSVNAVKAAFSTAGLQGDTYAEVLDGMNNSLGNVNEGFDVASQTSAFKFKQALVDLQVAGVQLGESLMPIATKIADKLSSLAKGFSSMSEETREKIIKVGLALVAIGPALMIIAKLIKLFQFVVKVVRIAGTTIIAVGRALRSLGKGGLIIGAIVLAVGLLIKNWEWTKKKMVEVINYFIDLYNESTIFKIAVEGIKFGFKALWNYIQFWFKNVKAVFTGLGNAIVDLINFRSPVDSIKQIGKDIKDAAKDFTEKTAKDFETMVDNINSKEKVEFITEDDIQKKVDGVKNKVGGLVDNLKDMTGGALDDLVSPESTEVDVDATANITDINVDTTGGGDGGGGGVSTGKDDNPFQSVLDKWKETMEGMQEQLDNFVSDFGEGFADMVSTTIMEGNNLREAFAGFMKDMIKQVGQLIVKMMVMKALMAIFNPAGSVGGLFGGGGLGGLFGGGGGVTPFASGGLVSGPVMGLVGEASTNSNPEVIAPLSDLQGMLGGIGSGRLSGEIQGGDILLSSDRTRNTQYRVSGSNTDF